MSKKLNWTNLDDVFPVHEQVEDVGHGGGCPAASLGVELIETLGRVGESVWGGAVLYPVSLL